MKNRMPQNIFKYFIGLITVVVLRLIPHPPNVEPITSTMMPFSKKWGGFAGFVFAVLSVLSFDLITGTLGVWSLMTAGSFGLISFGAGLYFKKRKSSVLNYVVYSIIATLVYDAITGIGTGMLFFNQTFMTTFLGQIPFTLNHLAGNVVLSAVLSPILYKWVVTNERFETDRVFGFLGVVEGKS